MIKKNYINAYGNPLNDIGGMPIRFGDLRGSLLRTAPGIASPKGDGSQSLALAMTILKGTYAILA
jgi:hypothetical protein